MHLCDKTTRFYGGNAIVGGGLPLAVGLALADKAQGRRRITACFFGEGRVAEGEFHESMNLAELWRVPVLFVCENNLYAMGTALALSESVTGVTKKAIADAVPSSAVDGMDVLAVEKEARKAAELVRSGEGPYLLECRIIAFALTRCGFPDEPIGRDVCRSHTDHGNSDTADLLTHDLESVHKPGQEYGRRALLVVVPDGMLIVARSRSSTRKHLG